MSSEIHFLKRSEIDEHAWNQCISLDPSDLPYAHSWVLDSVCENWWALVKKSGSDYHQVMPLPWRRKYFLHYAYQPYPLQRLGVFGAGEKQLDTFLKALPKKMRFMDQFVKQSSGYNYQERVNYILPLNLSFENLREGFSGNHQRHIRKAENRGLHFREDIDPNKILELAKANLDLHFLDERGYQAIEKLMKATQTKGLAHFIGVEKAEELLAGLFLMNYKSRLIYLFAVSGEEGRKEKAMFHLVRNIIERHANSSLVLDFEGSMIPGIAEFFRGFGAKTEAYYHIRINKLPFPLRLFKA